MIRELLVVSGKGGTGKTSLAAAFAHLAENKVVCDLDVDAPDLHILLAPEVLSQSAFVSGFEAAIDPKRCSGCGACADVCRFEAVVDAPGGLFAIDPVRCEGCKTCVVMCPEKAVDFTPRTCGEQYFSRTRFGPFVHARLFPGQENSGRLVSLLKNLARTQAEEEGLGLILADGAPGIGCPVISSLSGVTLAVIVTEPTPSGLHDLCRVAELCTHFKVPAAVIVNKYDLSRAMCARIEETCRELHIPVAARLPFDPKMTETMVRREAVTESESGLAREVRRAWQAVGELLAAAETK